MEIEEPLSCDISMVVSESDDDIIFANSQEDKDDSATSSNTEAHCSRTEINNSSDKNETSHTGAVIRVKTLYKSGRLHFTFTQENAPQVHALI
ncbi:hypothetical protein J6590_034894 [Homalodisca vitripennis]|nr:hypothetical protein J6590_034894 [Homalodisca vitripennis]